MKNLIIEFQNPSAKYRGKPFWAWNGKLEEEELRKQIRIMKQMGLGGGFMHSRVGLVTPYLSEEWFQLINACADEAKKNNMEVWLYDEDRWPSGAAGGLVTRNPKYRMRSLIIEEWKSGKKMPKEIKPLFIFSAKREGERLYDIERLKLPKAGAPIDVDGKTIFCGFVKIDDNSAWFNGYTYLDTLNPQAVKEFIKITYEGYYKHSKQFFGSIIPGIFTDEPYRGGLRRWQNEDGCVAIRLPWTDNLPVVFKKMFGYDIMPQILSLAFDVEGINSKRIRYHYYRCLTKMFTDAFAKQIGEWCEKKGILFTGHILNEDSIISMNTVVGSCMSFYQYMQAPGMDLLTEHWCLYALAKMVSSVARQFDRTWRLTETYGCTGWDFPFEGHKALGDWQAALGINLRCHHLSWYTMKGEAKRDYPASIFHHSPWWERYRYVEDYFARVNVVMMQGAEVRDLLVIHPVESGWLYHKPNCWEDEEYKKLDKNYLTLCKELLSNQLDFDYADEEILAKYGKVERGANKTYLRVNKARYTTILVHSLKTVRRSTLKLLKEFRAAGGIVVFGGEVPTLVEAEHSNELIEFANTCLKTPAFGTELIGTLEKAVRRIKVVDEKGENIPSILYYLREDNNAYYLFLCNSSHTKEQLMADNLQSDIKVRERRVEVPYAKIGIYAKNFNGTTEEWDPETGEVFEIDHKKEEDMVVIETSFARLGSRLFVLHKGKKAEGKRKRRVGMREIRQEIIPYDTFKISMSEQNVVVLDMPRWRMNRGNFNDNTEILRVDAAVRKHLGLPVRGGDMVQPWAQKIDKKLAKLTCELELVYNFEVESIPSGDLHLAVETPSDFSFELNGTPVQNIFDEGWWVDKSLRLLRIEPTVLRKGENELIVKCVYSQKMELEIMYLLGNFGVLIKNNVPVIVEPINELRVGDWVEQGLPFYGGNLTYFLKLKTEFNNNEKVYLKVPEWRGTALQLFVNNKAVGIRGWPPYEFDITNVIESGKEFDVGIEILGHRRNSHGPLHLKEKWPMWTGPAQFMMLDKYFQKEYQLVPCGLLEKPVISIRC